MNAIDQIFATALECQNSGRLDTAEILYTSLLERNPEHFLAAYNLGAIYFNRGQHREAADSFRRAIAIDDTSFVAFKALAQPYKMLDPNMALEVLRYARFLEPECSDTQKELAEVLQYLGRTDTPSCGYEPENDPTLGRFSDDGRPRVLLIAARYGMPLFASPWVPLGLCNIAAVLRQNGVHVKIVDNNLDWLGKRNLPELLRRFRPTMVGISAMTVQASDAMQLGEIVKAHDPSIRLVYGGVHFTSLPDDGLAHGDVVVMGDGEEAMLELIQNRPLNEIQGVAFRQNGQVVTTSRRERKRDLDHLPIPAYDLVKLGQYQDRLITGERAISVMTGRGCPYSCTFCASPALTQRRVAYHSIEYMERHIRFLVENHGMKSLRIMDDTFTLNRKRVLAFCDMIERNGFKLTMTCLTNVKNADHELFLRMKQVGFIIVAFGLESGNDEILSSIEKGTTKAQCREAVKAAYDAGLYVEGLFMIGHPKEKRSTIQQTIDFAKEINPDYVNWFQFSTPFPGSELWNYWHQYGTMRSMNWRLFDHQQPLFIPHGLDPQTMIAMRNEALQTCNQEWTNVMARHRQATAAAA